jgi:methylphosphotriester-DNA--protein-cysteine methyltransferase
MIQHTSLNNSQLLGLIRQNKNLMAGNFVLKIYGRLNCTSGKRMKKTNRVFFINATEATRAGFRPCGHCMREQFKEWKRASIF